MQPIFVEKPLPHVGISRKSASRATLASERSVQVNLAESPLGWLRARGYLSERLFSAGEHLRTDYARAGLASRVTMDWDASPLARQARGANRIDEQTLGMIDAKARFDAAIAHAGPGFTDILWRVVCACEALPQVEGRFGWPPRSARVVLSLALDRIADYYRINEDSARKGERA
jgi:Domain of unknown function (DUF6456)